MHTELGRAFWRETASTAPGAAAQRSVKPHCTAAGGIVHLRVLRVFFNYSHSFFGRRQARVLRKGYLFTDHVKLLNWPEAGVFSSHSQLGGGDRHENRLPRCSGREEGWSLHVSLRVS